MFEIRRYTNNDALTWNKFVVQSKQGTFLFDRRYMDYHANRFCDHSIMVYRDSQLYALLPANSVEKTLFSHQGLTYGGLLTNEKATAADVCEVFKEINEHLKAEGFERIVYKPTPYVYHRLPAEEDLYALFNTCHAQLCVRNIASVVDLQCPVKWRRDRHYAANKAHTDGITVEKSTDLAAFWTILEDNLMRTYQAKPVHSLAEMQRLQDSFPDNIQLYVSKKGEIVLGGTLLYITPQVVHTQYISATTEGKHMHAIDAIFRHLLAKDNGNCRYFDFGTSNEDQGRYLNTSLIYQKEGFGGRGVCYDTYEWRL